MKLWKPANSGEFWSKESARADWWLRTLLLQFCNWLDAAAREGAAGFRYCTTVTARRFCDQHEMSLQMATGRSLPNDCDVMRCWLTPRETR